MIRFYCYDYYIHIIHLFNGKQRNDKWLVGAHWLLIVG